jgi:hypothetical protein
MQLPAQAARQLPDQSTTLRVESSSTDNPRLPGALPIGDMHGDLHLIFARSAKSSRAASMLFEVQRHALCAASLLIDHPTSRSAIGARTLRSAMAKTYLQVQNLVGAKWGHGLLWYFRPHSLLAGFSRYSHVNFVRAGQSCFSAAAADDAKAAEARQMVNTAGRGHVSLSISVDAFRILLCSLDFARALAGLCRHPPRRARH